MQRFTNFTAAALVLLAVGGCAGAGAHVGRAAKPVVVKKSVRTYTLENGVTVIFKDTGRSSPTAVQVWLGGGSAGDPEDRPGLSHFVEHVLFTGSLHLPPGRAEHYIESMGGELFGHTGRDFSYMGVTLPGPGWERALDILFDLTAYPSFRPEQVEKQKKMLALEIDQREREPDGLLMDNLFSAAYKVHPYSNLVTGGLAGAYSLTREDAVNHYTKTYVPSNITVVVVGDLKAGAVKTQSEKTFGQLLPAAYKKTMATIEPYQLYSRRIIVGGPVKLTYMATGWHICAASDPDIYPFEVLRAVLGQGKGSRLFMELRTRMGAVYDVEAELFPLREPGMLAVVAHLKEEDLKRTLDEILRQINKLKDETVSEAELARAISNIEASHMLGTEAAEGQAYALGYWAAVYGGVDPAEYIQRIRKVTPEDVRRVAQKYLGEGNYTLSVIKPARD